MSRTRSVTRYPRESSFTFSNAFSHASNTNSRGGAAATGGSIPRFEELGFNYGFSRADPEKNAGYCLVYRTLISKLEKGGMACRIRADENEIRLTELEGPLNQREKVRIFAHDIISYYKFNHRAKFVAICIDAYQKKKTGYWFLCFEREGQLSAFCEYLNWLFGLDVLDAYDGREEDRVSYVDRQSANARSFLLSQPRKAKNRHEADAYDSGYTDSSSVSHRSLTITPPPPPSKWTRPKYLSSKTNPSKRVFRRW